MLRPNLCDYDFPISHDHYRSLCAMHGQPVPPKLGNLYLPSEEEYRQQFIEWQDKQREMVFGYSSKEIKTLPSVHNQQHMYNNQQSNYGVGGIVYREEKEKKVVKRRNNDKPF